MKTITPEKQARAAQIEACINKASKHFKFPRPGDVHQAVQLRCVRGQKTRTAVWYHMRECGYTLRQIARIWRKDPDVIRRWLKDPLAQMQPRDMEMIRSLPFIDGGKEQA